MLFCLVGIEHVRIRFFKVEVDVMFAGVYKRSIEGERREVPTGSPFHQGVDALRQQTFCFNMCIFFIVSKDPLRTCV